MNHLESLSGSLRHRYVLQRHGESEANQQQIIVSNPDRGINGFGLVRRRVFNVGRIVRTFKNRLLGVWPVVIISSDFLRARQTAEITRRIFRVRSVIFDKRLRERDFGELEGKSTDHYEEVWAKDKEDSGHTEWGVESADSVLDRTTELVLELERTRRRKSTIILVSHGDTLQILQTAFEGLSPGEHRSLPKFEPGRMREVVLRRKVSK